jgi:hypothetical protein
MYEIMKNVEAVDKAVNPVTEIQDTVTKERINYRLLSSPDFFFPAVV